jgi:hypothetical protein
VCNLINRNQGLILTAAGIETMKKLSGYGNNNVEEDGVVELNQGYIEVTRGGTMTRYVADGPVKVEVKKGDTISRGPNAEIEVEDTTL